MKTYISSEQYDDSFQAGAGNPSSEASHPTLPRSLRALLALSFVVVVTILSIHNGMVVEARSVPPHAGHFPGRVSH
jgi:hypothetical protein